MPFVHIFMTDLRVYLKLTCLLLGFGGKLNFKMAKPTLSPMTQNNPSFQDMFHLWSDITAQVLYAPLSPWVMGKSFSEAALSLTHNPAFFWEAQQRLSADLSDLWYATLEQMSTGKKTLPLIFPEKNDKRFKNALWEEHPYFNFLKQSYLLNGKYLLSLIDHVDGLDPKAAHKLSFYTRQLIDAASPSNFLLTNPAVIEKTLETGGQNLLKGFENFLSDLERGKGQLSISMTRPEDFELGINLAVTPGKVIFQNPLFQLIQYTPTTLSVARVPLLMVPPWINKYYIFDLRPQNSFVRWLVDQGHTVFMISWVNPDATLAEKTFEDYMLQGLLEAVRIVQKITTEPQVNLLGYCLGGNLVACLLAYLAAHQQDDIASATYLATLIDFSQAGDLTVFLDEEQIEATEARMAEKGYLEGQAMATTFSLLRANDLIWSFVVNNYLLGQDPFPLDFLYWNSDPTRMPAAMHSYYLRNMFQKNLLQEPGGLILGGVALDLRSIKTPTFILASKEDHIAPWKSCYQAVPLYQGPVEFVLASSGHVAGVINPPAAEKYSYFTNSHREEKASDWLKTAQETKGSWWPYWQKWLSSLQNETVKARLLTPIDFPPLEDAPGSYVSVRE